MLITFKSRASGDVIMFENSGREMLRLLGKGFDDNKGIVTVDQLPGAITSLKKFVEDDKAKNAKPLDNEMETASDSDDSVHLFQRAQPILELLERSLKDKAPVIWGV
jgi:hypothetical protein